MKLRGPITIVVPGPPPRKNERHGIAWNERTGRRPILVDTREAKAWWGELALSWGMLRERPITSGVWTIVVRHWWPRERHMPDLSFGFGDLDAPISHVLDGLQVIGALDDDVRFDDGHFYRRHDKGNPRVEVVLQEIDPEGPEQLGLEPL